MLRRLFLSSLLVTCVLPTAASAQLSGPGLFWSGTSGSQAGSFLPDCTEYPVRAQRGETVTIRVWADRNSVYGLMLSPLSAPCAPIPGFDGGLLLGGPLVPLVVGRVTQYSPCLACPEMFQDHVVTIPVTTPVGLNVSFQAVGFGWGTLAFTCSITATIG